MIKKLFNMSNNRVVPVLINFFDKLEKNWESPRFMKLIGTVTVTFYLLSLLLIELKRNGLLGEQYGFIPTNHFKSIQLAFTLLLFFELITMVFSLEKSVSKSMHIQLEILSLILLRSGFKLLGDLPEVITWEALKTNVVYVFSDAFGALMIFVGVLFIKKFERNLSICLTTDMLNNFIKIKKLVALVLLFIFVFLIVIDVVNFFMERETFNLFYAIYTTLIFSDVLIVFISLRFSESYLVLFRNSGFALGTVIIRLALNTKPPFNAIMGVVATLFILALVYFYNKAYGEEAKSKNLVETFKMKNN
jgi:hypothetical protein